MQSEQYEHDKPNWWYDRLEPNVMLNGDSYKASHHLLQPPGVTRAFNFLESRGWTDEGAAVLKEAAYALGVSDERLAEVLADRQKYALKETVFYGLQLDTKRYLTGPVVTEEKIEEAYELLAMHFDNPRIFNRAGWEFILKEYGGNLPLEIRAVAEGTVVPLKNALMSVVNTDPHVSWLPGYVETQQMRVWYPTTVASQGRVMRADILRYLFETGTPALIDFMLVDFGARGVETLESAGTGGSGHLVHFKATDNLHALRVLRAYYDERMAGFSIPAAEHGNIISWGRKREAEALSNLITVYPTGPVAGISDTYNVFDCCRKIWGGKLRDQVLQRDGVTIIRPDSGDPVKVLLEVLNILGERFGFTVNDKGYKVLNPKIRVIQGDGIDRFTVPKILEALKLAFWSADNLVFGSGGGLLQKLNRDTLKFAIKNSAVEFDGVFQRGIWVREGVWEGVRKDPITDPGKTSKEGLLVLRHTAETGFYTESVPRYADLSVNNRLDVTYRNGRMVTDQAFRDVRALALAA